MTGKKKISIGIVVLFLGVLLWQFGFLNRYNYLTAKIDIIRDSPKIVSIGKIVPCGDPCKSLNKKYGFYESNIGCKINDPLLRGIDAYNAEIEKYLTKINGENWRNEYNAELNYMIEIGTIE